jgi:hypothetical protein
MQPCCTTIYRNQVAIINSSGLLKLLYFHFYFGRPMSLHHPPTPQHVRSRYASLLAWPAWLRVLAILPAVALLWLGVAWALTPAAPW